MTNFLAQGLARFAICWVIVSTVGAFRAVVFIVALLVILIPKPASIFRKADHERR